MHFEHVVGTAHWTRLAAGTALLLFGLAGCVEDIDPRPVASAECPAWSMYPPLFYGNEPSPYLGCDQNVNLLNMVERTGDTISGRPLGPADGELQILAVKNYEADKVTPLAGASTTAGASQ